MNKRRTHGRWAHVGPAAARYVTTMMGLGDAYYEQEANQTARHLCQFALRMLRRELRRQKADRR